MNKGARLDKITPPQADALSNPSESPPEHSLSRHAQRIPCRVLSPTQTRINARLSPISHFSFLGGNRVGKIKKHL